MSSMAKRGQEMKGENIKSVVAIAYFDILGFKRMVKDENNTTEDILCLINQLRNYIAEKSGEGGFITPMPPDGRWQDGCTQFVWAVFPLNIQFDYLSDTFILWADFGDRPHPSMMHVFLDAVQWFFCKALQNGIALRGAISAGDAHMDKEKKIYFGTAFNEAATAEPTQNWIGIAYANERYLPLLTSNFGK